MQNNPVINMEATGKNIIRLRQKKGMSVKELQDIFGFATPQAIYKWQRGTVLPTVDNLLILAELFQVHIDDILIMEKRES